MELFSNRARAVVVHAYDEARMLKHDSIGCEHLLLALVREERGRVALIFKSLNTTAERTRARVARNVGPGSEVASGEVAFTREAKKALELSLHEALSLTTTSSGPGTSCSASCVRRKAWRRDRYRCWTLTRSKLAVVIRSTERHEDSVAVRMRMLLR